MTPFILRGPTIALGPLAAAIPPIIASIGASAGTAATAAGTTAAAGTAAATGATAAAAAGSTLLPAITVTAAPLAAGGAGAGAAAAAGGVAAAGAGAGLALTGVSNPGTLTPFSPLGGPVGTPANPATMLGKLAAGATIGSSVLGGISALRGTPKAATVGTPPVPPSFGAGLTSANQSLAALNPSLALGGTASGGFAPGPSGGGKTLLGQ